MTPDEAVSLLQFVKAACPAQALTEHTPEAWAVALAATPLDAAKDAAAQLVREREFVHVSHIVQRVRVNRDKAARRLPPTDPPADLDPDNPAAYIAWMRRQPRALEAS